MTSPCDVFISHCCRTTKDTAKLLHDFLEEAGVSTFICLEMSPGAAFRDEILLNAINCKVMIILLDEAWTNSMECVAEFNCAFRCYTQRAKPEMLPIVFGSFEWIKHNTKEGARAYLFTSIFQCLSVTSGTKEELEDTCKKVLSRLSYLSITEEKTNEKLDVAEKGQDNLSTLANLRSFTTCEICQEIFKEPRLMPCNHTFCLHCLIDWEKENNRNQQEFTCPKCRIPCAESASDLKTDFKINQLVELNEKASKSRSSDQGSSGSAQSTSGSSPMDQGQSEKTSQELMDWFQKYNIPQDIQDAVIEEGFESLDLVLELTDEDLKGMGLKTGHRKRVLKSISDHKKQQDAVSAAPISTPEASVGEFQMIEDIYDERSLTTGTTPADSIKFWASLNETRLNDVTKLIKKLGDTLQNDTKQSFDIKARQLSKISMVLCDAGNFADAETFAIASLSFEKDNARSYNTKVMLAYIVQRKLKQVMFINKANAASWNHLSGICDEIIKNGSKYLEKPKLCKLYIIKCFAVQSMCENDTSWRKKKGQEGIDAIKKALELCDEMGSEASGLRAEALMTQGLILYAMSSKNRREQMRLLLEARKLCLSTYGEFSSLMSRIYHNLGVDLEIFEKVDEAYECFRRTWLIDHRLWGLHHTNTKKSRQVLDEPGYQEVARRKGDPLTVEEDLGLHDLDFKSRLAFLDSLEI